MAYKIIDEAHGWDDDVFETKEDVRQALITAFWYDFQDEMTTEEANALPLETILENALLKIEEI